MVAWLANSGHQGVDMLHLRSRRRAPPGACLAGFDMGAQNLHWSTQPTMLFTLSPAPFCSKVGERLTL